MSVENLRVSVRLLSSSEKYLEIAVDVKNINRKYFIVLLREKNSFIYILMK